MKRSIYFLLIETFISLTVIMIYTDAKKKSNIENVARMSKDLAKKKKGLTFEWTTHKSESKKIVDRIPGAVARSVACK